MLALLTNRTFLEVAGVLLLVLGFTLYERHEGAANCVAADVAAVATQETHNAAVEVTQTAAITQEAETHAAAIALPTLPVPALRCVRIGAAPRPVPQTAAAQPLSHGASDVPAADRSDTQSFDPGPQLGKIGQACDAQVSELQSYIRQVVEAK